LQGNFFRWISVKLGYKRFQPLFVLVKPFGFIVMSKRMRLQAYCQVNTCGKETPGSIPNPAVKLPAADGSMVITPCESRYRLAFLS